MKKAIILSIVCLTFLLIVSVAAVVYFHRNDGSAETSTTAGETMSAEERVRLGRQALAARDLQEAYSNFREAASLEPGNADVQWEAAKLANLLGDKPLLRNYAEAAWENGLHDSQVLFLLLSTYDGSDAYLRRKGLALLDKVQDPLLKKELLGELTVRTGDTRRGIELLRSVYGEDPNTRVALKLARVLFLSGDKQGALELLEEVRARQELTDEMLNLFVTAAVFSDDYSRADEILKELSGKEGLDDSLKLKKAVFRMAQGRYPEAEQELESLRKSLAAEAGPTGIHPMSGTVRLYLAFLYALANNEEEIRDLLQQSEGETARALDGSTDDPSGARKADLRRLEGEQKLYAFLMEKDEARSWELQNEARLLLPEEPVSTFFALRHYMFNGKFEEGVELFRKIRNDNPRKAMYGPDGIFYRNPVFLVNMAEAFAQNQQTDTALALVGWLHDRGIHSRRSIQLIRDLTYARQQHEQSRDVQQALREMNKDDKSLAFQGAILDMNTGHLEASLKTLDALLREKPKNPPVQVARIDVLTRQGKYREALKASEEPDLPEDKRCVLRARIYEQMGETARAEENYRRSLDLNDRPTAKLEFANFLLAQGRADEASVIYRALLKDKPDEPSSLMGLASIDLDNGRTKEARAKIQRVLEKNQRIGYAYILLAKIDLVEGRNEEAVLDCDRALSLNPNNAYARFLRAQARTQTALSKKDPLDRKVSLLMAERSLNDCDRLYPDNLQILTAWLLVKINLEAYQDALSIADRLLARDPENVFLAKTRAELLSKLGRENDLVNALASLKKILPEEELLLFRASLPASRQEYARALAILAPHVDRASVAYRWALLAPLAGKDPDRIYKTVSGFRFDPAQWFALGVAAEEAKQFSLAVKCYARALEQNPDAPEILNNFAWCSLQAGDFRPQEVADAARRAYEALPDNPAVLDTYATVLLACGRPTDTIRLLQGNDKLVRTHPFLLLSLARALETSGDIRAAADAYRSLAAYSDAELPAGIQREEIEKKMQPEGSDA